MIDIWKKILLLLLICTNIIMMTSCRASNLFGNNEDTVRSPLLSSSTTGTTNTNKNISLRFAVMADCRGSDNGINTKAIRKTLESLKKITPQPVFAMMPGDLVGGADSYSEEKAQLQYFKSVILDFYSIDFFYPGFGNHEATAGIKGEQAFEEVFSEFKANFEEGYHKTVYYFDNGGNRFYMLNSDHPGESHSISDKQLKWIKLNSDRTIKHCFYFFHEPAYPTGSQIGSSLDANRMQRDKLWEIIDNSEKPVVFCGHEHNYTRRHINSDFNEIVESRSFQFNKTIYQVTTGSFGAPIYTAYKSKRNVDIPPVLEYHFAIVDVTDRKVEVTVYNLNGKVIDRFEQ